MTTELQQLKAAIEDGDEFIEAYEMVDLDAMHAEGDAATAVMIAQVLHLVGIINDKAGVE